MTPASEAGNPYARRGDEREGCGGRQVTYKFAAGGSNAEALRKNVEAYVEGCL